jgi:hypothetical protein
MKYGEKNNAEHIVRTLFGFDLNKINREKLDENIGMWNGKISSNPTKINYEFEEDTYFFRLYIEEVERPPFSRVPKEPLKIRSWVPVVISQRNTEINISELKIGDELFLKGFWTSRISSENLDESELQYIEAIKMVWSNIEPFEGKNQIIIKGTLVHKQFVETRTKDGSVLFNQETGLAIPLTDFEENVVGKTYRKYTSSRVRTVFYLGVNTLNGIVYLKCMAFNRYASHVSQDLIIGDYIKCVGRIQTFVGRDAQVHCYLRVFKLKNKK